jgi:hypothetical protein
MGSRKSLSVEAATEIIYNDDSCGELIPQLDSSDSESEEDKSAVSGAVQVIVHFHPTSQPMQA